MAYYELDRSGDEVDQLLDKIEDLNEATITKSGTMAAQDKRKLDQLEHDEPLTILEIDELLNF